MRNRNLKPGLLEWSAESYEKRITQGRNLTEDKKKYCGRLC
ncbi:MAG: hypothetical protein PVJ67_06610 [Candidatus Pacearchaeota archaeon]|jgi:hypothetical protein